jgi:hypothetical protein
MTSLIHPACLLLLATAFLGCSAPVEKDRTAEKRGPEPDRIYDTNKQDYIPNPDYELAQENRRR